MSASSVIYVLDLPRMGAFYESCFGLVTVANEDSYRILESEAWLLTLVKTPARLAATIKMTSPPQRRTDSPIKLTFAVRSIAQIRARAAELGGGIDSADTQWQFNGALRCDGIDPEGNVIQLRQFAATSA